MMQWLEVTMQDPLKFRYNAYMVMTMKLQRSTAESSQIQS